MDRTVPAGAALLLDFIGSIEAPRGYDTIYGNNQGKLPKPLTTMTVDEVIASGPIWTKAYRSSAAGRYQFMNATLKGLKKELGLLGSQLFDANLQDRLGYHLLKRRGYETFISGKLSVEGFGRNLAMEWASLPVLSDMQAGPRAVKRGQSYYAGDGLNKSLTKPAAVEALLGTILAGQQAPIPIPGVKPKPDGFPGWLIIAVLAAAALAAFFFVRF